MNDLMLQFTPSVRAKVVRAYDSAEAEPFDAMTDAEKLQFPHLNEVRIDAPCAVEARDVARAVLEHMQSQSCITIEAHYNPTHRIQLVEELVAIVCATFGAGKHPDTERLAHLTAHHKLCIDNNVEHENELRAELEKATAQLKQASADLCAPVDWRQKMPLELQRWQQMEADLSRLTAERDEANRRAARKDSAFCGLITERDTATREAEDRTGRIRNLVAANDRLAVVNDSLRAQLAEQGRQNAAMREALEKCKRCPEYTIDGRVSDIANAALATTAGQAYIPREEHEQENHVTQWTETRKAILAPASCGISGHFKFQENGGQCMMCQRDAALRAAHEQTLAVLRECESAMAKVKHSSNENECAACMLSRARNAAREHLAKASK